MTQSFTAVLLPGIDGTAKMFDSFQQALAPEITSQTIAYPAQQFLDYKTLIQYVIERLPSGSVVLIAESFSGPLALMVAEQLGERCLALVLVATFVSNPRKWESGLINRFLHPRMLSLRPSKTMARFFVMGDAADEVVEFVLNNHKHVAGHVTLGRLRAVFKVDVRHLLKQCRIPILHLYAKRDKVVLMRSVREIQSLRPDIPSICIDGPHFVLQTRSSQCATAVKQFLRKVNVLSEA